MSPDGWSMTWTRTPDFSYSPGKSIFMPSMSMNPSPRKISRFFGRNGVVAVLFVEFHGSVGLMAFAVPPHITYIGDFFAYETVDVGFHVGGFEFFEPEPPESGEPFAFLPFRL